jgi:hypothetical protein
VCFFSSVAFFVDARLAGMDAVSFFFDARFAGVDAVSFFFDARFAGVDAVSFFQKRPPSALAATAHLFPSSPVMRVPFFSKRAQYPSPFGEGSVPVYDARVPLGAFLHGGIFDI